MRFQHHSTATNAIHLDGLRYRPRTRHPAAYIDPQRLSTAAALLGFGLNRASCDGFVADHWPHWAGGLPADAPPRPGTAGYADFIAHGQPKPGAKPDAKEEPTAR